MKPRPDPITMTLMLTYMGSKLIIRRVGARAEWSPPSGTVVVEIDPTLSDGVLMREAKRKVREAWIESQSESIGAHATSLSEALRRGVTFTAKD